jgi:hypothetical protein
MHTEYFAVILVSNAISSKGKKLIESAEDDSQMTS